MSTHAPDDAAGLGRAVVGALPDILGALPAVVWEADVESDTMLFVSERARDLVGFDPAVWVAEPRFWERHLHPDDREAAEQAARRAIDRHETARIEYRFQVGDGSYRWFQDSLQVTTDADGRKRLVGVMVDVHEQRSRLEKAQREAVEAVEAARRDALTDVTTGLPSRRLLDAVLPSRQDDLDRHHQAFGLLVVEVDDFNAFSIMFTEAAAAQALRVVGATIRGGLRSGDTAVRWGDASFAIVAARVDAEGMHWLAERLLRLVRATIVPVPLGTSQVRASIGGALGHPQESSEGLQARTEAALAAAKASGGDRFVLNEPPAAHPEPRTLGVRW